MDPNNLNQIALVPNMPAFYPAYYPGAPAKAETFQVYRAKASQMGVTTLDVYSAPGTLTAPGNALGQSRAIPGNGIVLAGNAPYAGIYTGIQQE